MKSMNIYWANLCILNRMEKEKMEAAASAWRKNEETNPCIIYLGDTEEVQMYERMDRDMAEGRVSFDGIVSSRFDLFTWGKYLLGHKDELIPLRNVFPVREEIAGTGVLDPYELFHPLVVLPHFILCNTDLLAGRSRPSSLEDLLDPFWAGKILIGDTELPSGKLAVFAMWYLFGKEGLETCVRNWRRKSAPAAARHGVLKGQAAAAVLSAVFTGPGPGNELVCISPSEGTPVLPSFCAVRKGPTAGKTLEFLKASAGSPDFIAFYKDKAFAYPSLREIGPPEEPAPHGRMFFPDWEWIEKQDMEYFHDACLRMPKV